MRADTGGSTLPSNSFRTSFVWRGFVGHTSNYCQWPDNIFKEFEFSTERGLALKFTCTTWVTKIQDCISSDLRKSLLPRCLRPSLSTHCSPYLFTPSSPFSNLFAHLCKSFTLYEALLSARPLLIKSVHLIFGAHLQDLQPDSFLYTNNNNNMLYFPIQLHYRYLII